MSWGWNSFATSQQHPNCEVGFFWDTASNKCRKRILQIRFDMFPDKSGHGSAHPGDYFNTVSGLLFTLFYIAAIVFVVKLYLRYLCCWRPRSVMQTINGLESQRQSELIRRRFADASRLRGSNLSMSRFQANSGNSTTSVSSDFIVSIPPPNYIPSSASGSGSGSYKAGHELPPTYEEATKGS